MKKLSFMLLSLLITGTVYSEERAPELVIGKILPKRPKVDVDKDKEVDQPSKEKRPHEGDLGKNIPMFKHKKFPSHWGNPPVLQTRDIRPLPGGFGTGSSTLAGWISDNLKRDEISVPIIDPRPKPPVKPVRSPEILEKLKFLQEKKKEMAEVRKDLAEELKGKSKKDAILLVRNFKEANKQKHLEIKEAQKVVIEDIRSRKQTGAKRD